jgi:hypothetical protein
MGEGERSASKVTRRLSSERERDDDDDDEKLEDPRCKTVLVSDRTDARDESVNRPQKSQHLKKQTRGINKGGGGQQLPPPQERDSLALETRHLALQPRASLCRIVTSHTKPKKGYTRGVFCSKVSIVPARLRPRPRRTQRMDDPRRSLRWIDRAGGRVL